MHFFVDWEDVDLYTYSLDKVCQDVSSFHPCRHTRDIMNSEKKSLPGRMMTDSIVHIACCWFITQNREQRQRPNMVLVLHALSQQS